MITTTCEKCRTLPFCADHGSDGVLKYHKEVIEEMRAALHVAYDWMGIGALLVMPGAEPIASAWDMAHLQEAECQVIEALQL